MGFFGKLMGTSGIKKANRANESRYQQALGLFDQARPGIGRAFASQRQAIGQAQDLTREGFGQALGSVAMMGQRSRQSARDIGASTTGQQSAALQQRGLGTSTRLAGLARGVASQTQRGVQGVNEGVAGAQSSLYAQQGARLASIQNLLGNSFVNQNQALNQWRLSRINTIASRQDIAAPGLLGTIASAAGGIGSLMGGMGGMFGPAPKPN